MDKKTREAIDIGKRILKAMAFHVEEENALTHLITIAQEYLKEKTNAND